MNHYDISRRKVLVGMGAVGLASAGAGFGTSAFYSDEESFDDNLLVAGELDLKVDWQVTYTGPNGFEYIDAFPDRYTNDPDNPDALLRDDLGNIVTGPDDIQDPVFSREQLAANFETTVDDPQVETAFRAQFANVPDDLDRPIIELSDVKPGDEGEVTFSLHLFDNPGYIWMTGDLIANRENSVEEPERTDEDEDNDAPIPEGDVDDAGELADALHAVIWYDENGNNVLDEGEDILLENSLAEVLATLDEGFGLPLDGDRSNDGGEEGEIRDCFPNSTTQYIGFKWSLPVDHANEVQTDSVEFDLGFYTEQCRHNDGSGIGEGLELSTGHADWTVVQSPDGTTGDALVTDPHPAWATSGCASWVDPYANPPDESDPVGEYVYELDFEIETPTPVDALIIEHYGADNPVEFFLDGTSIGGTGGQSAFGTLRSDIDPVDDLAPGPHTLTAVVQNNAGSGGNPTGLLVCARLG